SVDSGLLYHSPTGPRNQAHHPPTPTPQKPTAHNPLRTPHFRSKRRGAHHSWTSAPPRLQTPHLLGAHLAPWCLGGSVHKPPVVPRLAQHLPEAGAHDRKVADVHHVVIVGIARLQQFGLQVSHRRSGERNSAAIGQRPGALHPPAISARSQRGQGIRKEPIAV